MVGLQLHAKKNKKTKNLAALWTGLWLGFDLQKKTRWLCSRSLLAGGGLVRLEGRRMLSLLAGGAVSHPLVRDECLFCQKPPVACGTFTKSGRGKRNLAILDFWGTLQKTQLDFTIALKI